jgi:2-polyprenyl-3-methyl-5-hydroxy-6-metoxy-1,4-benzoquinol methylase
VLRDAFAAPVLRPKGSRRLLARAVRAVRPAEWFAFGVPYRGLGRLLDFGCGAGKFLSRMHALGWDVTGLDFSHTAVDAVRAPGLRAVQGTLPHPDLALRSFDAVTLRQALEHLPEPRLTIRCAWDLLDRGGLLLVQVPNFASWDVDLFGEAAMELDLPRHLNHFTPATLRTMIAREVSGPVQVRQTTHPSWIRKGAERATERSWRNRALRSPFVCRGASMLSRLAGRANEIVATAVKP